MVLIVNSSENDGKIAAEIFHYMGILACQKKPHAALGEISLRYSAVLVMHPERFPDIEDFIARMTSYARAVPLFAISDAPAELCHAELFVDVFPSGVVSSRLASAMMEYARSHDLPVVGEYRLSGIDLCADSYGATYFDRSVPLTKTECMILRYLVRCYPSPADTKSVLKHAYRPSRRPELSGIRAHICAINKKWRELFGENIIEHQRGRGYLILTPIVKEEQELSLSKN